MKKPSLFLGVLLACPVFGGGFQAGVARVDITPDLPFWLTGYASRSQPATNVVQRIAAKGLALEDPAGSRFVLVTADLIGIPATICDAAAERVERITGLKRSQVLFNASHTHAGPVVWSNLQVMFDLNAADQARAEAYARGLVTQLSDVATQAVARLAPARVSFAEGEIGFATNRRQFTGNGVRIGVNPAGPMDHTVPVLKVASPEGGLQAVVFGYACHNTTLGGDCYSVHGDYAGQAQAALETAHPGVNAMFLMLCGGDQNPHPRGTFALAEEHGRALATEVDRVLDQPMRELQPPVRTAFETLSVDFAPHTRETFAEEAQSNDVFRQRRARMMLDAYDRGEPVQQLDYPVQAVRLGPDFTLLALAGEVVVDYALRAKREFCGEGNLVVAGYCNDVACYISTARIIREGGYEPVSSMIYYGKPGPLADTAEETIMVGARKVLAEVGWTP